MEPLTTQIVGSYAKPNWLARHEKMRTYDGSWWRPEASVLQEAKEDAVRLAIYEQERAGLKLLTDGEQQRVAYDRHFLQGLSGIELDFLVEDQRVDEIPTRNRKQSAEDDYAEYRNTRVVVSGPIEWRTPSVIEEYVFAQGVARRPLKANVAGPLTLSLRLANRFYESDDDLVLALARSVNSEIRALEKAGARIIQIDEPAFHTNFSRARVIGEEAIRIAVDGVSSQIIVHACYGYAFAFEEKRANPWYSEVIRILSRCPIHGISIEYEQPQHQPDLLEAAGEKHIVLGLISMGRTDVESPEQIEGRLVEVLRRFPAERIHPASDCGMWFLSRETAFGKIESLVRGTERAAKRLGLPYS